MTEREHNLEWLAFRYAHDEMGEAERASFEDRLECDQLAREAVATAVEISQAVAANGPAPAPRHRAWMVAGAAAGLLIAVAGWTAARLTRDATNMPHAAGLARAERPVPAGTVVSEWVDLRGAAGADVALMPLAEEEAVEPLLESPVAEKELEVPRWLTAALSPPQEESASDHHGRNDES